MDRLNTATAALLQSRAQTRTAAATAPYCETRALAALRISETTFGSEGSWLASAMNLLSTRPLHNLQE